MGAIMNEVPAPLTILRLREVAERLSLSRSTIYDKLNPCSSRHDPTFPKQVSLGAKAVGWKLHEVEAWIRTRTVVSRG